MTRALVLSGGGTIGIAWETGVVAGLAEEGVLLAGAGLIVGTSAGAVVGAQLAIGRSPAEMVERQLQLRIEPRPAMPPQGAPNVAPLLAALSAVREGQLSPEANRALLGAFALSAGTMSEDDFIAGFGGRVAGTTEWPPNFLCTAVETSGGAFVRWDHTSGVDLARAIAASCAVPAVFPPITINGRRYMDGGMRSNTNADLAAGYETVVILALSGAPPSADPRAELARQRLESEVESLRAAGAQSIEVIGPDEAAREAFGPNLMEVGRNPEAAQAGLRQGRDAAARLRAIWV